MSNPSKRKGTAWETKIVDYLKDNGWDARRKPQTGTADEGDISIEEIDWLVIEAKAAKSHELAAWVDEANVEAENAHARIGVVWAKRRGRTSAGGGYVVMDGDSFAEIVATLVGLYEALEEVDDAR